MTAGDRLFGDMSEPAHAYALGVVAASGRQRKDAIEIPLVGNGEPLLGLLSARAPGDIPANYFIEDGWVRVEPPLAAQAARWLGAPPGAHEKLVFPTLRRELGWAFVRGLLDARGHVASKKKPTLRVRIERPGARLLEGLLEFTQVPPDRIGRHHLHFTGHNALDLLGHVYDDCDGAPKLASPERAATCRAVPYRAKHFARYLAWAHRVPPFAGPSEIAENIRWTAVHPDAVGPQKRRVSDSGYDLTLLYEKKRLGSVILYGTGLVVEPPFGWYLDVVPRSSIIKTGYLLANSVGIIDRGYRGEILVPLLKIDPGADELSLPARVVQMVPRPIVHLGLERAGRSSQSHRGSGGFGSTG